LILASARGWAVGLPRTGCSHPVFRVACGAERTFWTLKTLMHVTYARMMGAPQGYRRGRTRWNRSSTTGSSGILSRSGSIRTARGPDTDHQRHGRHVGTVRVRDQSRATHSERNARDDRAGRSAVPRKPRQGAPGDPEVHHVRPYPPTPVAMSQVDGRRGPTGSGDSASREADIRSGDLRPGRLTTKVPMNRPRGPTF
jgi:hypothetical protein